MASAVALVTGHEEPGKSESALDWDALAIFPGTLVIYMGVTTAKIWTEALIAAGKDPATPTALVRRCSHPDQTTIHCQLDQVADRLTPASNFRPPVIAIIGAVTTLAKTMNWIHKRPIHGQTIVVTRPTDQANSLADAIRNYGGHPIMNSNSDLIGDDEYDGLAGRGSQINGMCSLASGKAFDVALFRMQLAIAADEDEHKDGDKKDDEKKHDKKKEEPKKPKKK